MTTVTVFTAERMQEIEDNAIVSGSLVDDHLILVKHNGEEVDAGFVNVALWQSNVDANEFNLTNIGCIESVVNTLVSTLPEGTLDTSLHSMFDVTLEADVEFIFENPAPAGKDTTFSLIVRGDFDPSWPATVLWPGGVEPTYDSPSIYVFKTVDEGATWFGMLSGGGFL